MARLARVIAPGYPHHVTQRGNRRQQTFFCEADYAVYLDLLADWCAKCRVEVWAYCLMPNHVHLVAVPSDEDGLRRALGEAHRRYTRHVNLRELWRGYLWQGRFASFPMDEAHLLAAFRYIEHNPVRAGLAETPWQYPNSSAKFHVLGTADPLVRTDPCRDLVGDWSVFLGYPLDTGEIDALRAHERTGRPLGDTAFVESLERLVGRSLAPGKAGRKPKKAVR
jgi:putative transposase